MVVEVFLKQTGNTAKNWQRRGLMHSNWHKKPAKKQIANKMAICLCATFVQFANKCAKPVKYR